MSSTVSRQFVDDLANALEHLVDQARDAAGTTVADTTLDLLARHLRCVLRSSGGEVADWRLALLRKALDRSHDVTLGNGNLGYHLRRLAITADGRDASVDRLINGLAVVAVEERLKADAARIEAAESAGQRSSRNGAQAAADVGELQQRAVEAEAAADQLQGRVAQLESDLRDERKRVEFLRGYVPQDIAAESEAKGPASDAKVRVDTGIYARTRADGGESFQVRSTKDKPSRTFNTLDEAIAYRDGGSAGPGSEPPVGPPAEQVAA